MSRYSRVKALVAQVEAMARVSRTICVRLETRDYVAVCEHLLGRGNVGEACFLNVERVGDVMIVPDAGVARGTVVARAAL